MTSYRDWHVGMKVVCIGDPIRIAGVQVKYPTACLPRAGRTYTIREIRDDAGWGGEGIVVLLDECDNGAFIGRRAYRGIGHFHVEPGFSPERFRPIRQIKIDRSTKQKVEA